MKQDLYLLPYGSGKKGKIVAVDLFFLIFIIQNNETSSDTK